MPAGHAVTYPSKPGKIRVVFDAATKHKGTLINNKLLKSPDLLNSLIWLLFRFRKGKYASTADIEQMVYQIFVFEKDRVSLRFLWRNTTLNKNVDYVMNVHLFRKIDCPGCVNWSLNKTALDQNNTNPENIISKILKQFLHGWLPWFISDKGIANSIIKDVTCILRTGEFRATRYSKRKNTQFNVESYEPRTSNQGCK